MHDISDGTRILLHALAQGTLKMLQGGDFKTGFVSGAAGHLGSLIGSNISGRDPLAIVGRTLISSALGGLAAEQTGGTFEEGAYMAAMVHLFNHEAHFDGKQLELYDDDGNLVGKWNATSGRPGTSTADQSAVGSGPIPEGDYVARQDRLQFRNEQSFWGKVKSFFGRGTWPGGYRSWGNSRVWLEPAPGTETYDRSGFSIHGGSAPGSAGCIDLCGSMPNFTREFQRAGHDVNVIVDY